LIAARVTTRPGVPDLGLFLWDFREILGGGYRYHMTLKKNDKI
jgi:hypothetical protein